MSVCLNKNDRSVQNFTSKFGEKSAGALAEAVNNNMLPLIRKNGKIFISKLYSDILNNEKVRDNVHALDIYLKVYSDEFQSRFKGDFDANGEPILYVDGKPIVNLINDKSLSASESKTIEDMKSENKELFDKLITLMDSIGVSVGGFESYKYDYLLRTGYEFDGVALADMLNKVILIKEGATIEDLAEEVGHFAIESLGVEHAAVKAVLRDVENTAVYTEVLEAYGENSEYKNKDGSINYEKIRKEAAGKLLSAALIKKDKELQDSLPKRLLSNLMRVLRALYAKIDSKFKDALHRQLNQSLGDIASDILVGNFTEFKEDFDSDEIFHSSKATTKVKALALKTLRKLQTRLKFLEREKASPTTIKRTKKKIIDIKRAISEQEHEIGLLRFIENIGKDLSLTSDFMKNYKAGNTIMNYSTLMDMKTFLDYYSPLILEIRVMMGHGELFEDNAYYNTVFRFDKDIELRTHIKNTLGQIRDDVEMLNEFFKEESVNMYVKTVEEVKHEDDEIDARASAKEVVGDTSMIQYFFGSLANAKDSTLRIVQKILADINYTVNRHSLAVGKDLVSIYKKHGLTAKDTDSLYEVDSDGKATGYMINDFNLKAYDDSRKKFSDLLHKKLGLLDSEGNPLSKEERDVQFSIDLNLKREWGSAWKTWLDKNTDPVNNWQDVINERKSELTEDQFNMWLDINTTSFVSSSGTVKMYPGGELVTPNVSKYSNPAFKKVSSNPGLMELREALLSTKRDALLKQPAAYFNMESMYRLPQISKSFMQRIKMDKSIFKELPELLKDEFTTRVDDDYEAQLQTRGDGTTVKVVPIRYNRALENTDDISRDIISSFIEYSHMSENFLQKNKATPKLQNVRDIVSNRTFKDSKGVSEKGSKSNTLKALDKFLDMNLYGETKKNIEYTFNKGIPILGGRKINITKFVDKFHDYVRANNLVGNFFTVFVGATVGGMYSFIDRLTGQYSSVESGRWAQKNFLSNFMEVFNGIGSPVQTNKMELMFEHHQVFSNAKEIFEDINKSRASRIAGRKLLYGLYGGADYKMKGTMTMSIYDNYRLNIEEGKWYTKDQFLNRNYKDNKKAGQKAWEAMRENSYWNAFETKFNKEGGKIVKGSVVVKDKFKKFINDDMINQMTARVRNINSRIDGVISEEDRAAVHQGTWSQLLATHRGWLFQGIAQRLKHKGVNYSTGQMEEGYFRTTGKALLKFLRYAYNPKLMMNMFEDWHNLEDYQRYNLLRATYELGAILGTYTAALILNNLAEDEDEDDWFINAMAYTSTRALLETSIFVPPFVANELTSTLSNPIASARHIENMVSIMDLLNTDDVRSGPYKGHSKAIKYLIKSTPGLRGWWEVRDPAGKNRFLKMKALKMYPGL